MLRVVLCLACLPFLQIQSFGQTAIKKVIVVDEEAQADVQKLKDSDMLARWEASVPAEVERNARDGHATAPSDQFGRKLAEVLPTLQQDLAAELNQATLNLNSRLVTILTRENPKWAEEVDKISKEHPLPSNKPVLRFELQAVCPETGARAGILHTDHGDVETPVFMPVGTQATIKGVLPRDMMGDLDAKILLSNTYHLYLRPGHETVRKLGGLHKFMAWPRAILTDSGGFQVFSLDSLRKVTEEGVLFHSHLNGDPHFFTPESTIDVQMALGSDIMMVLDECLAYPASHEAARVSTERTLRWARSAYAHYRSRSEGRQACFPIVQGSMFPDLRRHCTEQLLELDADGYAIGGLSVGEPRVLSMEMTEVTAPLLPRDRPRYTMGVGMPDELPEYVARGIDMMDCVLPSRNARNGNLFTKTGRVVIKQAQYKDDPAPIDKYCECYTCRNFSRAYLRHLFLAGEMTFSTLATLHNLRRYLDIMGEIRQAIQFEKFPAYLQSVRAARALTDVTGGVK